MAVLAYGNDGLLIDDVGDFLVDDAGDNFSTVEPEITLTWGSGASAVLLEWPDPEPEGD